MVAPCAGGKGGGSWGIKGESCEKLGVGSREGGEVETVLAAGGGGRRKIQALNVV